MIKLNLLPEVKQEYLRTRRLQLKVMSIASITTMAAIGLVVLLAAWVYGGQTWQKADLTSKIDQNSQRLKSVPEVNEYLTVQNQLDHLSELHAAKNDFSRLMNYLPALNPAKPHNVRLNNIELSATDGDNRLHLQGEVADYTGLNTFRDTLTNAELKYDDLSEPLFETVAVTSSSLERNRLTGGDLVAFKIELIYNPNAFLASINNPTVVVPNINTTQSLRNAPDVFGGSESEEGGQQ